MKRLIRISGLFIMILAETALSDLETPKSAFLGLSPPQLSEKEISELLVKKKTEISSNEAKIFPIYLRGSALSHDFDYEWMKENMHIYPQNTAQHEKQLYFNAIRRE